MIKNKKKAKKIVAEILRRLELKPCDSINKALNDPTVRAYLGVVEDKRGEKFFLKVRVQDIESEKRFFWKTYVFEKILKENPWLSFNKKTPKLLKASYGVEKQARLPNFSPKQKIWKRGSEYNLEKGIDYFLWEFVKGEDLGTRAYYDVIRIRMDEIDEILYILKSLLEIPIKLFPKDYDYRGTEYFKDKFRDCLNLRLKRYFSDQEIGKLEKISEHPLLDKYQRFFSHGDFKPNNFIRAKNGLYVVDFETSSISNQFFDFFSIWGYAVRKPGWRKVLMKRFLDWYKFKNTEERRLFELVKIMFLMREFGSLIFYLKRNLTKSGVRVAKRYLPIRVMELKEELKRFSG